MTEPGEYTSTIRDLERLAAALPELTRTMISRGRHIGRAGDTTAPTLVEAQAAADVLLKLAGAMRRDLSRAETDEMETPF